MSTPFREPRNVELSLNYYLETNLTADWPGTNVIKTFAQVYDKDVSLPVVCVRLADIQTTRREVGSTTLENRYLIILDLFVTSDGMRLDLADYIKDKLKDGWVNYEHSHASGNNIVLLRNPNGRDFIVDFLTDSRLDFGETGSSKDKFRQTISFLVRHQDG